MEMPQNMQPNRLFVPPLEAEPSVFSSVLEAESFVGSSVSSEAERLLCFAVNVLLFKPRFSCVKMK